MFSSNTSQQSEGYQIQRSLRFNSADSAYLNRTPASASNRKTWTWSSWVKLNKSATQNILTANIFSSGSDSLALRFSLDTATLQIFNSGSGTSSVSTTAVFRDYSAWYHIVFAVDTTQATASDRVKIYINGVQQATTGTITLNYDTPVNSSSWAAGIGAWNNGSFGMDGYLTEINFIDGQALTPSSFGAFDAQTGVWGPTPYAGTYGTNGFYLNFSDNSNTTATTLGKDYSGNGNNWTPNNFSVSAGAGNDSLVDVPTAWGTDTGVGGEVRGNYATMNPLQKSSNVTLTNGNLDSAVGSSDGKVLATIGMSSGKWYAETSNFVGAPTVGIATGASTLSLFTGGDVNSWGYFPSGAKYTNSAPSTYGASWTSSDTIGIAFDADAGTLTFYKNGISQGTAFSGLTSGPYFFSNGNSANTSCSWNFGQRPFAYAAPSGFKALCTQNLPTPTVGATASTQAGKYFNAVTYTGNGSTQSITGVGFQPDLVWAKIRNDAYSNGLFDAVRGVTKHLVSDTTAAENTLSGVTSFNSDGFSLGISYNASSSPYVAWNWKANGAGVTNTAGSITSTVSANTTSGFSVVTYTGNASGGATIGHGLGSAPKMVIIKNRGATSDWIVGHSSLTSWGYFLKLNTTAAQASASTVWNNTAPTSTVVTLGSDGAVNGSTASMVAYCFAEVQGFSKFGSYTGNGSTDGPFVYCGFRPKYVMTKRSDAAGENWHILDTVRNTSNVEDKLLYPNLANAEGTFSTLDITSNGFKLRNSDVGFNANGGTYIFAAFAEAPQKFALAR